MKEMDKKLIIHIGLHKTGSSFLQHCVFPKLKGVNYIYKPNHPLYVPILASRINLMSDEEISQSMPHQQNDFIMIDKLHNQYPDAKIIIGVRQPISWLKSCYAQYIKTGGILTFGDYCVKYIINETMTPLRYYSEIHMLWKNVYMYWHEDLITNRAAIVRGICEFIGVPVPEYTNRHINVSLKNVERWRRINKVFHGEWLRKHLDSPWWIWTFISRRLKREYRMDK